MGDNRDVSADIGSGASQEPLLNLLRFCLGDLKDVHAGGGFFLI